MNNPDEILKNHWLKKDSVRVGNIVASGSYGTVYEGWYGKLKVAIKDYRLNYDRLDYDDRVDIMEEFKLMKELNHTNTVRVYGFILHKGSLALVMEYATKGSLKGFIQKKSLRSDVVLQYHILLQIALAMRFIHSENILHRDLKPDNVLVFEDKTSSFTLKITDFGEARKLNTAERSLTFGKGTFTYMDPAAATKRNNKATDFYSFCVLALEVLTGQFVPKIPTLDDLLKRDVPKIPEDIPLNLRLHLSSGFDEDQDKRSSWTDVIVALQQAIDSKNGGIFVDKKDSMIFRRQNETKPLLLMDHLHRMYVAMIKPRKKWLIVGLAMVLIFILTAIIVPITIYALNDAKSSESQVTSTIPTTPIATNTTTPITTMTTPTTSQVTSTMPTTLTSTATPITTLTTPTTTQITSTIPTTLTSTIIITMTTQTTTQVASTMPTTLTTKTTPITTLTTPTTSQVTSTTLTIPTAITTWPIPTTTSDKPSKKRAIIVVATGIGENNTYVTSTEIIDFNNPSESCTPWADSFDFKVGSAVGGFFDNGLVICSAVPTQESEATTSGCFVVNQTVASPFSTELKYAFTGASGVMIDRENFLITGGYNDTVQPQNKSEILSKTGVLIGPELPIAVGFHCMIATEHGVYSTGGYDDTYMSNARSETWFLAKGSSEWKPEPDLISARSGHACGSFTFNNNTVLVISGKTGGQIISSTEFLNLGEENRAWQLGPQLPYVSVEQYGHRIVSNEESLYYINTFGNMFYKLMCPDPELLSNCYWESLINAELKYPRSWAVALMLPEDMLNMVNCKTPSTTASTTTTRTNHLS